MLLSSSGTRPSSLSLYHSLLPSLQNSRSPFAYYSKYALRQYSSTKRPTASQTTSKTVSNSTKEQLKSISNNNPKSTKDSVTSKAKKTKATKESNTVPLPQTASSPTTPISSSSDLEYPAEQEEIPLSHEENYPLDDPSASAPQETNGNDKKLSIEEMYQKKTPVEHILLRPDSYIGSILHTHQEQWVYNSKERRMIFKECKYPPKKYIFFQNLN